MDILLSESHIFGIFQIVSKKWNNSKFGIYYNSYTSQTISNHVDGNNKSDIVA